MYTLQQCRRRRGARWGEKKNLKQFEIESRRACGNTKQLQNINLSFRESNCEFFSFCRHSPTRPVSSSSAPEILRCADDFIRFIFFLLRLVSHSKICKHVSMFHYIIWWWYHFQLNSKLRKSIVWILIEAICAAHSLASSLCQRCNSLLRAHQLKAWHICIITPFRGIIVVLLLFKIKRDW